MTVREAAAGPPPGRRERRSDGEFCPGLECNLKRPVSLFPAVRFLFSSFCANRGDLVRFLSLRVKKQYVHKIKHPRERNVAVDSSLNKKPRNAESGRCAGVEKKKKNKKN